MKPSSQAANSKLSFNRVISFSEPPPVWKLSEGAANSFQLKRWIIPESVLTASLLLFYLKNRTFFVLKVKLNSRLTFIVQAAVGSNSECSVSIKNFRWRALKVAILPSLQSANNNRWLSSTFKLLIVWSGDKVFDKTALSSLCRKSHNWNQI